MAILGQNSLILQPLIIYSVCFCCYSGNVKHRKAPMESDTLLDSLSEILTSWGPWLWFHSFWSSTLSTWLPPLHLSDLPSLWLLHRSLKTWTHFIPCPAPSLPLFCSPLRLPSGLLHCKTSLSILLTYPLWRINSLKAKSTSVLYVPPPAAAPVGWMFCEYLRREEVGREERKNACIHWPGKDVKGVLLEIKCVWQTECIGLYMSCGVLKAVGKMFTKMSVVVVAECSPSWVSFLFTFFIFFGMLEFSTASMYIVFMWTEESK